MLRQWQATLLPWLHELPPVITATVIDCVHTATLP